MEPVPTAPRHPQVSAGSPLSPRSALALAATFGLVGGYLDVGMILLKRDVLHFALYYEQSRHFFWSVPAACLAMMLVPGLAVAAVNRLRPGLVSCRAAVWVFATLAVWGPLLRAPLFGVASLVLAVGVGRVVSSRAGGGLRVFRRYALAGLLGLVAVTAAVTFGRRAAAESRALARLPAPSAGEPNVLVVVMDTVRAENLGLYGYPRDTTPRLAAWAKKGVKFDWALSPAPWTFPSHCSLMTGQWPSRLNAHWQPVLDPAFPTLAEFLGSKGYETAGFVANTYWCSYESRMDRGFAHYEDYPLSPRGVLAGTVAGRWLVEHVLSPGDYYGVKWVRSQSRDARGINRAFLDWLSRPERGGRPFFAFLNYLDAHEPFVAPREGGKGFGLRPESRRDYKMLLDYWDLDKLKLGARDQTLARDAYDDCIAALDREVGALLDELERRGVLKDTLVVITSDHGEEFGERGVFNHGFSLYAREVHVPLLILSPGAPAGRALSEPVSLRDVPATVVDVLGLGADSPFPGRSLARLWGKAPGPVSPPASPALSEVDVPAVVGPQRGRGPAQRGLVMSLVRGGRHYLVDARGHEELYDLESDPTELRDLVKSADALPALKSFRGALLRALTGEPPTGGAAGALLPGFRALLESLAGR